MVLSFKHAGISKNWLWDTPVIFFVFLAILWPILFTSIDHESVNVENIKFIDYCIGIVGNLYLLVWVMTGNGTKSKLWNWLPPFWPVGKMFSSQRTRFIIVILIVLGSTIGFLSEIGIIPKQF